MFPCSSTYDRVNSCGGNAPFLGNYSVRGFVDSKGVTNFNNLFFRNSGLIVFNAFVRSVSTLGHFVRIVVCPASQKHMGWIAASGVVAFVAYTKSILDLPISYFPSVPVGQNTFRKNFKGSVSSGIFSVLPIPTRIISIVGDMLPKIYPKRGLLCPSVFRIISNIFWVHDHGRMVDHNNNHVKGFTWHLA